DPRGDRATRAGADRGGDGGAIARRAQQNRLHARHERRAFCSRNNPGSDLLSHALTRAVPSAVEGLTSVFGMGTGVTPLLWPPGNCLRALRLGAKHTSEHVVGRNLVKIG